MISSTPTFLPQSVSSDHRSVQVHYYGAKIQAEFDLADLVSVVLLESRDGLVWHLLGNSNELLVPWGIPGEAEMRRELQRIPGFNSTLFFAYLNRNKGVCLPITVWPQDYRR